MTINPITTGYIEITQRSKNSSKELHEKFSLLKEELGEKINNNETEEAFIIGNGSFTVKEWDDFLKRFDKQEKAIQEEIKEEIEEREEEAISDDATLAELIGDRVDPLGKGANSVPYQYLIKDGVITYKGVTFVADETRNELMLGDCSDRKKCITVYLKNGGKLIANENSFEDLSKAISMFCPEDIKRILCAMADYKKIQETQQEIDEAENSIGEAEKELEE